MHFLAVLNRGGGTLAAMDVDAFAGQLRSILEASGHAVGIRIVEGADVVEALGQAASALGVDVIMAGGGDGTISAAAAALMNSDKALAVLPSGTMNLFARGLGIPLDLTRAVEVLAHGEVRRVDIATANGRPFVHQFSIGMHSDLIRRRESMSYSSRTGKIRASVMAALGTIVRPPRIRFRLELPDTVVEATASTLGVTNNVFSDGPLPVAERPDGGELGIYIARAHRAGELARLFVAVATGRWKQSASVEIHRAPSVVLKLPGKSGRVQCAIDGELGTVTAETVIESHPGALKVLLPSDARSAS